MVFLWAIYSHIEYQPNTSTHGNSDQRIDFLHELVFKKGNLDILLFLFITIAVTKENQPVIKIYGGTSRITGTKNPS